MNKFPLVVLSLLCALPALATEYESVSEVPRDATEIYSVERNGTADEDQLIRHALSEINDKESLRDLQLDCQKIFYKWSVESTPACGPSDRPEYWQYGMHCLNPLNLLFRDVFQVRSVGVTAYCEARSYDQKVLVSLRRRCEQSPTAECFDEKIKSAIQTIQPTVRYDIDKP